MPALPPLVNDPLPCHAGERDCFVPQAETTEGSLSLKNREALLSLAGQVDMVVIGPGLSLADETQQLVRELAAGIEKPLLVDGDGITALAGHPEIIRGRRAPTILTPHPGRCRASPGSRLWKSKKTDPDPPEVQRGSEGVDRPQRRPLPDRDAGGAGLHQPERESGDGDGGGGDVLTGTIAAMYGLGLPLEEAVRKGVFLHGLAGDLAAADKGEDGITAQDILNYLPYALKQDREGLDETLAERYEGPAMV